MDLPYPPRAGQLDLLRLVEGNQARGGHLVVEAATGTGKTITALVASLRAAELDGQKILWLTRTNSQQEQVVREHQALVTSGQAPGLLVPFMGRRHYCPLFRGRPDLADATAEELGRMCRDAKQKAQSAAEGGAAVPGACPFYAKLLRDGAAPIEALVRAGGLGAAELARRIEAAGSCPYEALKALLPDASVVVAPSIFVLDARLRDALLQWMGTTASAVHVIVDEAHHLPVAARDHNSPRLSVAAIQRAIREAEELHDPTLAGAVLATGLLDALLRVIGQLVTEHVQAGAEADDNEDPDGLVPPGAMEEALLMALGTTLAIRRIADDLLRWGEQLRQARRAQGRLPRSYLGAVGAFLLHWLDAGSPSYVNLVTGGKNPALERFLLDPAEALDWLPAFASTTHMSGTLAPVAEHAALCGLPQAEGHVLASPFDPRRLRIGALQGLSRSRRAERSDPRLVERMQAAARQALTRCTGRTALWFPSHQMLEDWLEEGFLHGVARALHAERRGMDQSALTELVLRFTKAAPDAILLGVLGGRLTEGLDFPGDALEHCLILGVPYPRPSARSQALIHHFDRRLGKGWEYGVHNPTGRVLRQAIGRLIRGPDDRGTALILDERAIRFRGLIPRMESVRPEAASQWPGPPPEGDGYVTANVLSRKAPPGGT